MLAALMSDLAGRAALHPRPPRAHHVLLIALAVSLAAHFLILHA